MLLKETINDMCSSDYKARFGAEYWQVRIRAEKLEKMLKDWEDGKLKFTPTCPKNTYYLQLKVMKEYIAILDLRALAEGIDVFEYLYSTKEG